MSAFSRSSGIYRQVAGENLDPANDSYSYDCAINISDLIQLSEVMDYLHLGPNGGLVYCMEYLEKNADWLEQKLKSLPKEAYLLLDWPGQVELYTRNKAVRMLFAKLSKVGHRLAAVHLADAHYCADPGKFNR